MFFFATFYVQEKILQRGVSDGPSDSPPEEENGVRKRESDFLQGMVMKIRFTKRLTVQDLDKNIFSVGKVLFSSCDQVQMKLTQLELNGVKVDANSNPIGNSWSVLLFHNWRILKVRCRMCLFIEYLYGTSESLYS